MAITEEELEASVSQSIERFRGKLGPRVTGAFDELDRRIHLTEREGPGYFFAEMALPIAQFPLWTAHFAARNSPRREEFSRWSDGALSSIVESAVMGYLHVRVQDDLIDEGMGRPDEAMLLAEAFFTRHQSMLARAVGDDERFWEFFEQSWMRYGEAMLVEALLHEQGGVSDEASFNAVIERSLPLAIPVVAVLTRASLWDRVDGCRTFVWLLVRAHQIFHDLLDAERDFAEGRETYVLSLLGAPQERETLHRELFINGGFDRIAAKAKGEMTGARDIALEVGFDEVLPFITERNALMARVQQGVFQAFFERLLAKTASTQ